MFTVTPQITLSAFTINHLTISCNSSFNGEKKSRSNWPWLISCETPSNYLFLLLYHCASMNSPPWSVFNKAHRWLSIPIKHIYISLFLLKVSFLFIIVLLLLLFLNTTITHKYPKVVILFLHQHKDSQIVDKQFQFHSTLCWVYCWGPLQ